VADTSVDHCARFSAISARNLAIWDDVLYVKIMLIPVIKNIVIKNTSPVHGINKIQ
jgi:hypothetical protein